MSVLDSGSGATSQPQPTPPAAAAAAGGRAVKFGGGAPSSDCANVSNGRAKQDQGQQQQQQQQQQPEQKPAAVAVATPQRPQRGLRKWFSKLRLIAKGGSKDSKSQNDPFERPDCRVRFATKRPEVYRYKGPTKTEKPDIYMSAIELSQRLEQCMAGVAQLVMNGTGGDHLNSLDSLLEDGSVEGMVMHQEEEEEQEQDDHHHHHRDDDHQVDNEKDNGCIDGHAHEDDGGSVPSLQSSSTTMSSSSSCCGSTAASTTLASYSPFMFASLSKKENGQITNIRGLEKLLTNHQPDAVYNVVQLQRQLWRQSFKSKKINKRRTSARRRSSTKIDEEEEAALIALAAMTKEEERQYEAQQLAQSSREYSAGAKLVARKMALWDAAEARKIHFDKH